MRRFAPAVASLAVLAALAVGAARAAVPGPRLAVTVIAGGHPGMADLGTVDLHGKNGQHLAGGPVDGRVVPLPEPATWSPDGATIAFAGQAGRGTASHLYLVGADGGKPREIPGTRAAEQPVFSPDGSAIAFERRDSKTGASIWLADTNGGSAPLRLTPRDPKVRIGPTSFSPDDSVLLATRQRDRTPPEVVAIHLGGGGMRVLAIDAAGGVFSPDGARIAYLLAFERRFRVPTAHGPAERAELTTDVFTMDADGRHPMRVTNTPRSFELWPSWDPSGQRLAVAVLPTRERAGGAVGQGDAIVQMNADGSCARNVIALPRAGLAGAVWQPGAGRAAGPIAC